MISKIREQQIRESALRKDDEEGDYDPSAIEFIFNNDEEFDLWCKLLSESVDSEDTSSE